MNKPNFQVMEEGSWYTICGTGGDLEQWIDGYEAELIGQDIGKPKEWVTFTGKDLNEHYKFANPFKDNVHFLAFPLDGLDVANLAIFRLANDDKWFDNFINNRRNG